MNKGSNISVICIGIFLCHIFSGTVFAGAFDNTGIGLQGMSMGNAFTGIADDASAVYYNPAGLVQHENHTWLAEVYSSITPSRFEYSANSITDKSDELFIVPGLFIARAYNDWAFGLGFYIPYAGGGTAYDDFQNSGLDLESFAAWFAFTPAIAYRLGEKFAVGAGLSLYMGEMESKNRYKPNNIPLVSQMKTKYDGIAGYGGHIGFMYKPTSVLSIGFAARSEVPIEMDGEVKIAGVKYDSEVKMTFPYSFDLGFGYKLEPNLTLGILFSYRLWGEMDEMKFKTAGVKDEIKTYYKNSWLIGWGIEHRYSDDFTVKGGMKFIQGATRDKGLNPGSNDVDILAGVLGMGYKISKSIEITLSFMYIYGLEIEHNSQKFDVDHPSLIVGFRSQN